MSEGAEVGNEVVTALEWPNQLTCRFARVRARSSPRQGLSLLSDRGRCLVPVSAGAVFSLKDPFVCCLRYRKPMLTGHVEKRLRRLSQEKTAELGVRALVFHR